MSIYYLGLPLLIFVAVFDAGVMGQIRVLNGQPSLMVMVLVAWVLLNHLDDALPWAVMGGILVDLLSVAPLGASSLAFVLMMVAIHNLFGLVGRRNIIFPPLAAALGTVIYLGILWVLLLISGWSSPPIGAFLRWILPTAAFNFLGILFVFRPLGLILAALRPPTTSSL